MNIQSLTVDGYGVWTGFEIEGLDDGLKVVFGPNEAGKTTLLQFIRSGLYSFTPARRRYLPPIHGGPWGGRIRVATDDGLLTVHRHLVTDDAGTEHERLELTDEDGTPVDADALQEILSDLDEGVFRNVFAVGLREMQELGTLSHSQAADQLYSLSIGLDRVSLVDVIRRLGRERRELVRHQMADRDEEEHLTDRTAPDDADRPRQLAGELADLLARRKTLNDELAPLTGATRRYARLAARRQELAGAVDQLEQHQLETEQLAREVELAITLRGRWRQRVELDEQLAALAPAETLPAGAVERLDRLVAQQGKHESAARDCIARRRALREEAAALPVHRALWRQSARIEAMQEQLPWIRSVQDDLAKLDAEVTSLEATLGRQRQALGLPELPEPDEEEPLDAGADIQPRRRPSTKMLKRLRPTARSLRERRDELQAARAKVDECERQLDQARRTMEQRMAGRSEAELLRAIDEVSTRVAQLRRRLHIDERLDELSRYQTELDEQSRELVDKQVLPMWVLMALGVGFVVGVFLIMLGLMMPESIFGTLGWWLAGLGLGGAIAAGAWKFLLERANERRLESCQQQLGMLQSQIRQAGEERDLLDQQLPSGGGPLASRLQTAEQQLAELEDLMPLKAQRENAEQSLAAARREAAEAEGDLAAARREWQQSLHRLGLPTALSPRQVRQVVGGLGELEEIGRRLSRRREELDARRRELDVLTQRIDQVVAECDVPVDGPSTTRLATLAGLLEQERARADRRRELAREDRRLRSQQNKHREMISRVAHRRRALVIEAGVADEQQLRQRALEAARAETLRRERDSLQREIEAAIAGTCSIDTLREHLQKGDADPDAPTSPDAADPANDPATDPLEIQRDELLVRLEAIETELKDKLEERGQIVEQMRSLADDRQLARKQLELSAVEARLARAVDRWKVLAVAGQVLGSIRVAYERDRQPETLREASGYLAALTEGRYSRVWTPLGEDELRVDDCDGNPLPVEVLSRGTREQLFLALRLALAASYARRGARLPMVLDDVLVNFDAQRARAAAAVLRDFAAEGFQLLVFTCHEHIARLFRRLKVPTRELPSSAGPNPEPLRFEPSPKNPRSSARPKPPEPKPSPTQPARQEKSKPAPPPEPPVATEPAPAKDEPLRSAAPARPPRPKPKQRPAAEPSPAPVEPPQPRPQPKPLTPAEVSPPPPPAGASPAVPSDRVFDADFFSTDEEPPVDFAGDFFVDDEDTETEDEPVEEDGCDVDGEFDEYDEQHEDSEPEDEDDTVQDDAEAADVSEDEETEEAEVEDDGDDDEEYDADYEYEGELDEEDTPDDEEWEEDWEGADEEEEWDEEDEEWDEEDEELDDDDDTDDDDDPDHSADAA